MKLNVLVVQNSAIISNKKTTFENTQTLLDKYSKEKFDLIVFPEVWQIGWYCKNFMTEAETLDNSETIAFLKETALNFNSLVIGGSFICKREDNVFTNTCPVISKSGKLITTYDKMHLFSHKGSEENKYISKGSELKILDLGGAKIGLSICYDIRFPEIYREYSKRGTDIFVNMAAWSNKKPEHWEIMHRARALENQCYMITADQTGKICAQEYNLGHSMVIDPWGKIKASLQAEEDCLVCEIDTETVKRLRDDFPLISDRRDKDVTYFNYKEINVYE